MMATLAAKEFLKKTLYITTSDNPSLNIRELRFGKDGFQGI
jgi:hypothetical protein